MKYCYRCNEELIEVILDGVKGGLFYDCLSCKSRYTSKNGQLHDRWLMPITLPLYGVIFSKDPLEMIDKTVIDMNKKGSEFVKVLVSHIEEELNNPKQKLTDIHDFISPNEERLREFLKEVKFRLSN